MRRSMKIKYEYKRAPHEALKVGASVNYHSIIGVKDSVECTIREEPYEARCGTTVCFVTGVDGYVHCDAISLREVKNANI